MSTPKGLLLVLMEPPVAMTEEFNEWYDTEHIPERAGIPGFETALRYICVTGWPRYMALYDLDSVAVLRSDAYKAIAGDNLTVWSKRTTRNVIGYYRLEGTQVFPGDATTFRNTGRAHITVLRFRDAAENALVDALGACGANPSIAQLRLYRNEFAAGEHVALVEHRNPVMDYTVPDILAGGKTGTIDLANTYAPYWRR